MDTQKKPGQEPIDAIKSKVSAKDVKTARLEAPKPTTIEVVTTPKVIIRGRITDINDDPIKSEIIGFDFKTRVDGEFELIYETSRLNEMLRITSDGCQTEYYFFQNKPAGEYDIGRITMNNTYRIVEILLTEMDEKLAKTLHALSKIEERDNYRPKILDLLFNKKKEKIKLKALQRLQ